MPLIIHQPHALLGDALLSAPQPSHTLTIVLTNQVPCTGVVVALGGFASAALATILGSEDCLGSPMVPVVEVAHQSVSTVASRVALAKTEQLAQVRHRSLVTYLRL
jgi:hypothetical protein